MEKQINENVPVAYVMTNDGVITDEFHKGDSYTKHTKQAKENKAKFLQEENECQIFNEGVSFVKLYDDILDELRKNLTPSEFTFVISLAKHVSYKDCILRTNGNPNGKFLAAKDISELLDVEDSRVRRLLSSLIKKGVLGRHQTGCKDRPDIMNKVITCNPYIFTRGNKVNTTILSLFQDSKWNISNKN